MAAAESGAQVQGVCPDGWHVASKAEWDFLINGCTDEDEPGTAPKEGDTYPWDPSPADFPTQGVTYGFNANDDGAALYPYIKTRGMSVRCVLDQD